MSPALLSKRLKDLEAAGVVQRIASPRDPEVMEYHLTQAGQELRPVVEAVGNWGQRWVRSELTLDNLDVGLLMWDMRRNLDPQPMPTAKSNIQFTYAELPTARRRWWLIVEPGKEVDLCSVEPGFDVDLFVSVDLRTMTEIWMGLTSVHAAIERDALNLVGNRDLERNMASWLGYSPFAAVKRQVA